MALNAVYLQMDWCSHMHIGVWSRAKCIIKYLSPTRILFHISQKRDLLKAFDVNVSVTKISSPLIIYYSISCNHNNQLTFSKTRPKSSEKSPYAAQRD